MNNLVSIGKILNFHGIKGEVKLGFSKQNANFIKLLKIVFVNKDGEYFPLKVSSVRFNNKNAIVKFEQINSIEDVMEYKGCLIYVENESLKKDLDEDEFLTSDLIGMDIVSEGKKLAVVVGLSNNGGSDLLAVKGVGQKISYIPFVKDICLDVDLENKIITIKNMEGLLE